VPIIKQTEPGIKPGMPIEVQSEPAISYEIIVFDNK
jgi:hypothetical protein